MKVIELLGPSGVGKTFLYKQLFEVYKDRKYMSVDEACVKAVKKMPITFKLSKITAYLYLIKSGLFGFKQVGLAKTILYKQTDTFNAVDNYKTSFQLLKEFLLSENNLTVFSQRILNFNKRVQLNYILEKFLDQQDVVLFDEGILHHLHGLYPEKLKENRIADIAADKALNPLGIISCELSFEQNYDRILKRRAKGIHTFSHKRLSDTDLKSYLKKNKTVYQDKINAISANGVPVLVLNTEDHLAANLNATHQFINNLILQ